jgi:hypothetical protein
MKVLLCSIICNQLFIVINLILKLNKKQYGKITEILYSRDFGNRIIILL